MQIQRVSGGRRAHFFTGHTLKRIRSSACVAAALFWVMSSAPSYAFLLYLEGGAGASLWVTPQPTFSALSGPTTGLGPAWQGGLFFNFGDGSSPLGIHLGAQWRSTTVTWTQSGSTQYHQIAAVLPTLRIQFSLITLGLSLSPWAWTRTALNWGLDGLQSASGRLVYSVDLGLVYPWTPTFSVGAQIGTQWVGAAGFFAGPWGPAPAVDAQIFMRFYFWKQRIAVGTASSAGGSGEVTPNEYKGWRYPFGWSK